MILYAAPNDFYGWALTREMENAVNVVFAAAAAWNSKL